MLAAAAATLACLPHCKCGPESGGGQPPRVSVIPGRPDLRKTAERIRKKYSRPVRVAVLDFVDAGGRPTPYGAFVSNVVLDRLRALPGIELIERSRLQLLLREHAREHAGIISGENARRLGRIVPADILVVGSYGPGADPGLTQVRGRFVELAGGEILGSFTLFLRESGPQKDPAKGEGDATLRCGRVQEPVLEALRDLRDSERVERLARTAILLPFDQECGRVHFHVMAMLESLRLFPEAYVGFLSAVLGDIRHPGRDRRTEPILRYFAADGQLTGTEWAGVRELITHTEHAYGIRRTLALVRRTPLLAEGRLDEVMQMAAQGRIGRPRVVAEDRILLELIKLLSRRSLGTPEERLAFYERLRTRLPAVFSARDRLLVSVFLRSNYRESTAPAHDAFLKHLVAFYSVPFPQDEATEQVWSFFNDLHRDLERASRDEDRALQQRRRTDLEGVGRAFSKLLCAGLAAGDRMSEERATVVLAGGLRCPGFPNVAKIMRDMGSRDEHVQLRAAKYLELLGTDARPAHDLALRYLAIRGSSHRARALRRHSARILGNLQSTDRRAIALLVQTLTDYEGATKEAGESLVRIGTPAVPALIQALRRSSRGGLRFRVVVVLGALGPLARQAVGPLQRIASEDPTSATAKQARASLILIGAKP